MSAPAQQEGALLYGMARICTFLGIPLRAGYHLAQRKRLPCWREGKVVVASRSGLNEWIAQRERDGAA